MGQRTVKTQTAVQVVQEVEGGVSLRQTNPSIDFLLPTVEPPYITPWSVITKM
jgi:hypothetical protein